jgi:hypothetical protein
MPRHPPNALKALDRSHYQYPPHFRELVAPVRRPRRVVILSFSTAPRTWRCGTERPVSTRDLSVNTAGRLRMPMGTAFSCAKRENPDKASIHDVRKQAVRSRTAKRHDKRDPDGRASGDPPAAVQWWSQTGSNRRPPACKAGALPAELWPLSLNETGGPG